MTESLITLEPTNFPRKTRGMMDSKRIAWWLRMAVGGGSMDKALVERAARAIYAVNELPFSGVRYINNLERSGIHDKVGRYIAGRIDEFRKYEIQERYAPKTMRLTSKQSTINGIIYREILPNIYGHEYMNYRFRGLGPFISTRSCMDFVDFIDEGKFLKPLPPCLTVMANALTVLFENCWMFSFGDGVLEVHQWPKTVCIDDNHQLHNPIGPALVLDSGQELWALRGVELPVFWQTDRHLATPADIVTIPDDQLRDALAEDMGWDRIAETLGVTVVEDSGDPIWGRLVDIWLPYTGPKRFLDALCGTGRRVLMPVSSDIGSVNDAQSKLHNGVPFWMLRMAERRT